ncbi:MAG: alpha/beta hydrolase [Sporichthyaceae bacterium]|nr:alpha/beta hydrolase [Sporichthyaceae bacterium]
MSRLQAAGKRAGVFGAAVGVVAAGAAVGLAAERYAVGRSFRRGDPARGEPFGELRGTPTYVVSDDSIDLYVEVEGDLDADLTILFVHGYALNQDAWHYQRKELGDLGRLVFYDQRAHGRSARGTRERATIDQLAHDLRAVIDAVAPDGPIVLVGHSMGGMTIMALADQYPGLFGDRITGAALLSSSPGRLAEVTIGAPAYTGRILHKLAPGFIAALARQAELVDKSRRVGSDLSYVLTKRLAFASDVPPTLVRFAARMLAQTPIDVVADFFPAFDAHDKLSALSVLQHVETLVMVGSHDLLTPEEHSKDIVRAVPGAELVVVPNAGHLLTLEHPEPVNRALRELVERARRTTGARR